MKSIEWAAGLFEGEGCITTSSNGNSKSLQLEMTDLDVVQDFAQIVGAGNICYKKRLDKPKWKPTYRWTIQRREMVYKILSLLLPYFGLRRAYKALNCLDDIDNHFYLKAKQNGFNMVPASWYST
jgi:hypothetical protein